MHLRVFLYRLRSIVTMLTGFSRPWQTIGIFSGRAGAGPWEIRTRNGGHTFEVRTPLDVWCLKETVLDRCYERYGFAIEPGWTVIDVGGGIGDFTLVAAVAAESGRVIAFEPFAPSFELLERNLARNEIEGVTAVPQALTGTRREVVLDAEDVEPLTIGERDIEPEHGVTVSSIALEDAMARFGLARVDLLKLDCEGGEYDIILGSPAALFDRIERIVMEYHDFGDPGAHLRLVSALEQRGYTVECVANPVHPEEIGYMKAGRRTNRERSMEYGEGRTT